MTTHAQLSAENYKQSNTVIRSILFRRVKLKWAKGVSPKLGARVSLAPHGAASASPHSYFVECGSVFSYFFYHVYVVGD